LGCFSVLGQSGFGQVMKGMEVDIGSVHTEDMIPVQTTEEDVAKYEGRHLLKDLDEALAVDTKH
jgi:hypothetical protein